VLDGGRRPGGRGEVFSVRGRCRIGGLISELVSNVVDHAYTLMTVQVGRRDSHLHFAVHDGASALSVRQCADATPAGAASGETGDR
jgi:hypothetical protein